MTFATTLAAQLASVPPQIATIILGTIPVIEIRGALPVALVIYQLPLVEALFWSILGNMLPVYFLLIFFERAANWISQKSPLAQKILESLYARTHGKLHAHIEKYGPWALTLFVAIPLPLTGAWTGALAAFVFGLSRQKAFVAILAGVTIAGIIVAALTLGISATAKAFL